MRAALAAANANSPKGSIEYRPNRMQIYTNDQASKASQIRDLVIAYRNGAAVQLSDVAEVVDSVEDLRNLGLYNGKPRGAGDPVPPAGREHHRHRRPREGACCRSCRPSLPADVEVIVADRPLHDDPRLAAATPSAR